MSHVVVAELGDKAVSVEVDAGAIGEVVAAAADVLRDGDPLVMVRTA